MKKVSLLSLVALLAAALMPASVLAKSYVNGIDANYPPHAYVDKQGNPAGFDVDAMDWIAKKMGFTITHKPMDWDGIIPALLAKKIDMVCSGMSISPDRQAVVAFTEPYWSVRKVFVVKNDSDLTVDQVTNGKKRVGVQRGTNEHELLQKNVEDGKANYILRFYDSSPMAIEDLLNGRADAIALDSAPANDAISKGKPIKIIGEFAPADDFGVAIRNEDVELREMINEGFKLLKADPYWTTLQEKYLK